MTAAPDLAASSLQTVEDVEDFVAGTNLLSGAGGSPEEALAHLRETLIDGANVGWQAIDDLDNDALVISAFYQGATDPESWRNRAKREVERGLLRRHMRPLEVAVSRLEELLGRPCDAIIPIEIGASNTAAVLDLGSRVSRPVLDGDYAGRAIPSLECILPAVHGQIRAPLVMADYYGDVVEVTRMASVGMLEAIAKMTSLATLGRVAAAGLPLSGAAVKGLAVCGTLSRSLAAGRMLRRARARGGDIVAQLCAGLPGCRLIFHGTLRRTERVEDPGYMTGTHTFGGDGAYAGRTLRVFFKNENHLAWLDDDLVISSPDVIEVVDLHTGEPQVNTYLEPGQQVAILGLPCPAVWQSPIAAGTLGPARWGFDLPFTPLVPIGARA